MWREMSHVLGDRAGQGGESVRCATDLAEADRLRLYPAAIRFGLGNPRAVPTPDALRWAARAMGADAELRAGS
jgi:hypothetical protein